MAALQLFFTRTRTGRAMRATAESPVAAQLMGIKVERMMGLTFFLSGLLAGGAGQLGTGLESGVPKVGELKEGLGIMESGVAKFRTNLPGTEDLERLQAQAPGLFDSGYFILAAIEGAQPADRNLASFAVNLERGGTAGQIVVGVGAILLCGIGLGLVNALLVRGFKIPSIIATLATLSILSGISLTLRETPGGIINRDFTAALKTSIGPVPVGVVVVLVGAALLEVVAALAVLSLAGLGLLELVTAHTRAMVTASARERELWDEERLLVAHVLLQAGELDLRLGSRVTGPYLVTVQRPEPHLYRIAVGRAATPLVEDLVTVTYRRRPDAPSRSRASPTAAKRYGVARRTAEARIPTTTGRLKIVFAATASVMPDLFRPRAPQAHAWRPNGAKTGRRRRRTSRRGPP